ncbi:MAG: aminoacyl-tRNA hydrolase [Bacteroidetes bacterium 4572_77]|nr:MAG: aminoacyl-tRNA hydrolase [Bacteroidetes bacterium 4572_77]
MKYLIAGLGNIGNEYENTRHNIGFDVLDRLAKEFDVKFNTERLAGVTRFRYKSRTFVLIKPTTYMNLSGRALKYWMDSEKIEIDKVLVVTDDLDLDLGTLRMRPKGSAGSHNGLENIIQVLGKSNFARLRFGIGNSFSRGRQVDYVLGQWKASEQAAVEEKIDVATEMIKSFGSIGVQRTMNLFNGK